MCTHQTKVKRNGKIMDFDDTFQKNALFLNFYIFEFLTSKKKFTYILVNGLIANFEFQSFWAKKVEFFFMERSFYPVQSSNFLRELQIHSKSDG